ncbi:hypothetical protein N7454_001358 [Penicillium verhagenii]|nr:hypothetical protein N7454_001358 [Penicillium verhagenii]
MVELPEKQFCQAYAHLTQIQTTLMGVRGHKIDPEMFTRLGITTEKPDRLYFQPVPGKFTYSGKDPPRDWDWDQGGIIDDAFTREAPDCHVRDWPDDTFYGVCLPNRDVQYHLATAFLDYQDVNINLNNNDEVGHHVDLHASAANDMIEEKDYETEWNSDESGKYCYDTDSNEPLIWKRFGYQSADDPTDSNFSRSQVLNAKNDPHGYRVIGSLNALSPVQSHRTFLVLITSDEPHTEDKPVMGFRPSVPVLLAILSEMLKAMKSQKRILEREPDQLIHTVFPILLRTFDVYGCADVFSAYYENGLKVYHTYSFDFEHFAGGPWEVGRSDHYITTMAELISWTWPHPLGCTAAPLSRDGNPNLLRLLVLANAREKGKRRVTGIEKEIEERKERLRVWQDELDGIVEEISKLTGGAD